MAKRWAWMVVGLGACTPPAPAPPPAPAVSAAPASTTITLVGTNDLHGHIEALPLFAGYVNVLRARGPVLLVDGGDMFQGTLASNLGEGAAVIRAYDALRYGAATVGNHEFDFGPVGEAVTPKDAGDDPRGALRARASQASFPLLSSNLLDAASGKRPAWNELPPTTMVAVAGVKVGIVGVTTEDTLRTTIAANVADLEVAPLAATIRDHAERLRGEGADVVVVAAHAGAECEAFHDPMDLSTCNEDEIVQVARALPEGSVDVIVAGHTHRGVAHEVNGIAVIESFAYGRAFGRVDVTVSEDEVATRIHPPQALCADHDANPATCAPSSYEGQVVSRDASVAAIIAPDLEAAAERERSPLGLELTADFLTERGKETPLSRWLADLIVAEGGGDVGLINGGGIRAPLKKGALLYGAFYQTFPFDNRFARVELSGAELKQLVLSGFHGGRSTYTFAGIEGEATCVGGVPQLTLRRGGAPVDPDDTLVLITSDYLATTDHPVFVTAREEGRVTLEDGPPMREMLVKRLQKRGGARDPSDADLRDERIEGQRPLPCLPVE